MGSFFFLRMVIMAIIQVCSMSYNLPWRSDLLQPAATAQNSPQGLLCGEQETDEEATIQNCSTKLKGLGRYHQPQKQSGSQSPEPPDGDTVQNTLLRSFCFVPSEISHADFAIQVFALGHDSQFSH